MNCTDTPCPFPNLKQITAHHHLSGKTVVVIWFDGTVEVETWREFSSDGQQWSTLDTTETVYKVAGAEGASVDEGERIYRILSEQWGGE